MKLPKAIDLSRAPKIKNKHAAQISYSRIHDLLLEFDAEEIGEILVAGLLYEIYGIELDPFDHETMETFPKLQDRACRAQYRQLLADFDANERAYKNKSEKSKKAALLRWHGSPDPGGINNAEDKTNIELQNMGESDLNIFYKELKKKYPNSESFMSGILQLYENNEITEDDRNNLLKMNSY